MSTLHHEALYETCFDESWEEFMKCNKLTDEMMTELCSFSTGTLDHIERRAWKKFQDMCQ